MGSIISIPLRRRRPSAVTDFLIRDIDQHVLDQLRSRAEQHGRSLQAEIKQTLKKSVRLSKEESLELLERMRDRLPHFDDDSTPLIREDRDSR
ncbi:MAG: Arc family DNA-binding protein [Actinobacteria bacterium]|nr:Arc family DNA-binding protein [Actinomycetota bacterium]